MPVPFQLRLRIPGWCRGTRITVNGEKEESPRRERGYAVLERVWAPGDRVDLEFRMPVERMEAHPAVGENAGRVALQRGPIVYGVEGLDNGDDVEILLAAEPDLRTDFRPDHLGGIVEISGRRADGGRFTAIPFYALANRKPSSQAVWLRQDGKGVSRGDGDEALYRPYAPGRPR
jgi:DUF1680 family protein